jgi:hypothetical protein
MLRRPGIAFNRSPGVVALALVVAACGGVATPSATPPASAAASGQAAAPASPSQPGPIPLASSAPGSGARIVSPPPQSTLSAGAVTFTWSDANGDYFLTVESVPGAHDVFFAIVHGTSVTLGPACAPVLPTGCIPPKGEAIYVKLMTQVKGKWNAGLEYSYTAAGG